MFKRLPVRIASVALIGAMVVAALLAGPWLRAAVPTNLSFTPIAAIPPNVTSTTARPVIMLNLSRDHQLFTRAYNEFSDYDGDGRPDGTYIHTVRYSGYFDSGKCYTYDRRSNRERYEPSTVLANRTDYCSNAWHGNFLNWATMTRIDLLRKVLYGGTRSTDTATLTILERAPLPMDAHSFAKYYANATTETLSRPNINRLTPFNETQVTFCNTTFARADDDDDVFSQTLDTADHPPLLRAARGNYALWNTHEVRQCRWGDEDDDFQVPGTANTPTGVNNPLGANRDYPPRSAALSGGDDGDFVVRVVACDAARVGGERCKGYGSSLKPIGLLQEYGDTDLAEFGLLTGSYSRNVSGGVLRKNVSSFTNEVNASNGVFLRPTHSIVGTLDRLRVYGMRYSNNLYSASDNGSGSGGFCAFQTIGLSDDMCASWGNPMGEMFIETLRYLRGNQGGGSYGPSSAYGAGSDPKGAVMGLTVANWVDPFARGAAVDNVFGAPQCRPINTVHFNASVTSYDLDTTAPFSTLGAPDTLAGYINAIGAGEGIHGTSRFVGRVGNSAVDNNTCTAKGVSQLSTVDGLCPLAPGYRGSFSLAGAAYWANTNAIRPVPASLGGTDAQRAYRVRSYAVALAPGVPRITVRTTGATPQTAVIQPAYQLVLPDGRRGSGTLVDFRVIEQNATSGRYLVVWEDSEQGGDYDMDVAGELRWNLSGNTLTVTTSVYQQATVNPQGFGYTISGTNRDGVHFHSGILGFNFTDTTGAPGCNNCQVGQPATTATYTINGNVAGSLEDPLWYAAKWGGFRNPDGSPLPPGATPAASQWDSIVNDTGLPGSDGVPDNLFVVFNPDQLEASLRRVFDSAVVTSNAAPAVSSTQLAANGFKYVATFDPRQLSGDILASRVGLDGEFPATPTWRAGATLEAVPASSRVVISNDQTQGIPFNWTTVSSSARAAFRTLLLSGSTPAIDSDQAQRVVRFVRGDRSVEGPNGIRTRSGTSLLGPVVNASPWLQEPPSARFVNRQHPGYSSYVTSNRTRPSVLWAASNDGMVHGFNATTGAPLLSYVPETIVPRLSQVVSAGSGVQAFVDGSPYTGDVDLNAGVTSTPNWRTFLFGSLGRGGRGLYALDVSDPAGFSESNAANIFRWQFTANDDPDLGHVLSDIAVRASTNQPMPIAKLEDGRFALIVGNGYGSRDRRAVLFILPVQGPNASGSWTGRYTKIVLDSPATGAPANGLMTPTLLDVDNDGRVDTVYAGDLRGNLWKVDLSSATPGSWASAYRSGTTAVPLWAPAAGDAVRPITGAPQVAFPEFGGVMVNFATGLSVLPADFPNTAVSQRVYGVWDRPAFATNGRPLPRGHAVLQSRTLSRQADGNVVITDGAAVDLLNATPALARDGWFFDLPTASEMVLSNIDYRGDNIYFTAVRPAGSGSATCGNAPQSTFYLLDPIAGLPGRRLLGTTTVSGTVYAIAGIAVSDQKVRVVNDSVRTAVPTPGQVCTGAACTTVACPAGLRVVGQNTDRTLCRNAAFARLQWREIPGMRTQ